MSVNSDIVERNRANAEHSTGPKTPEGKAKVSQNARKLGIFVADSTLEQEDPQEFADILAGYNNDYAPEGEIELELVRQLTVATHRLRRFERIETGIMYAEDDPDIRMDSTMVIAQLYKQNDQVLQTLDRARGRAERTFNRVYKELETRKAARSTPRPAPLQTQIVLDMKEEPTSGLVRAGNAKNKPKFAPDSWPGKQLRFAFGPRWIPTPPKKAA